MRTRSCMIESVWRMLILMHGQACSGWPAGQAAALERAAQPNLDRLPPLHMQARASSFHQQPRLMSDMHVTFGHTASRQACRHACQSRLRPPRHAIIATSRQLQL
jgi:hypothetical protein